MPFGLERYTQVHDLRVYFNTWNRVILLREFPFVYKFMYDFSIVLKLDREHWVKSYLCTSLRVMLRNYSKQSLNEFFKEGDSFRGFVDIDLKNKRIVQAQRRLFWLYAHPYASSMLRIWSSCVQSSLDCRGPPWACPYRMHPTRWNLREKNQRRSEIKICIAIKRKRVCSSLVAPKTS